MNKENKVIIENLRLRLITLKQQGYKVIYCERNTLPNHSSFGRENITVSSSKSENLTNKTIVLKSNDSIDDINTIILSYEETLNNPDVMTYFKDLFDKTIL